MALGFTKASDDLDNGLFYFQPSEIPPLPSFEARKNRLYQQAVFSVESGGDLLSRAVTSQVPSALKSLTSVFGMGTGGTSSSLPPKMVQCPCAH